MKVGLRKDWVVVRRVRSVVGYNTSAIVVSLPERLIMHLISANRVVVHRCGWWRIEKCVDMSDRLVWRGSLLEKNRWRDVTRIVVWIAA